MIIREGSTEEFVHIEDVDFIKQIEGKIGSFEICYMKNFKQIKLVFTSQERNIDKLIQVYKDFVHKSNLSRNGLAY